LIGYYGKKLKQTKNVKMNLRERKSVNLRLVSSLGKTKQVFRGSEDFYGESFFMMLNLERKRSQRSMRPSSAAQKEEERVGRGYFVQHAGR